MAPHAAGSRPRRRLSLLRGPSGQAPSSEPVPHHATPTHGPSLPQGLDQVSPSQRGHVAFRVLPSCTRGPWIRDITVLAALCPAASPCPTVCQPHSPGPLFNAARWPRVRKSTRHRAGVHTGVRSMSKFPLRTSINEGSSVKKKKKERLRRTCPHLCDHPPGPAGRPL